MSKVVLGITMSLDGYIQDKEGKFGQLYSDLFSEEDNTDSFKNNEVMQESVKNTGAVVMGRKAFMAGAEDPDTYSDTYLDGYADGYEFQVPIFVLTHKPPERKPKSNENLYITFVTDGIKSAISQAKKAAGDKDVTIIGGASTAQQALNSGLVDELQIDIMPMLFGGGLRFFENINVENIELEKIKVVEQTVRTHLRFRVKNLSK